LQTESDDFLMAPTQFLLGVLGPLVVEVTFVATHSVTIFAAELKRLLPDLKVGLLHLLPSLATPDFEDTTVLWVILRDKIPNFIAVVRLNFSDEFVSALVEHCYVVTHLRFLCGWPSLSQPNRADR